VTLLPTCLCFSVLWLADGQPRTSRYPRPELLVEATDLKRPKQDFCILDARPRGAFQAGHVPGAVWVDHAGWSRDFNKDQDPETWSRRVGELGIDVDVPVVVYDDGSTKDVARIWWILRFWGVRDVRLLNGGWRAWQAAGGEIAQQTSPPASRSPKLSPRANRLATKEQILAWLRDNDRQIIDARTQGEFCGEAKTAKRNGAMPGAIHLEWVELLDKDQRFKKPEELAKLFQDAGIRLHCPAVTHCQSGGRSSVMAFALELMGADDVRNYYKSWAEWGNDPDTPVVRPPK